MVKDLILKHNDSFIWDVQKVKICCCDVDFEYILNLYLKDNDRLLWHYSCTDGYTIKTYMLFYFIAKQLHANDNIFGIVNRAFTLGFNSLKVWNII